MSRPVQHLNEEQLLRYADGELPPREGNLARQHLEACWQCRVECEELQKTIAECVRYRKEIQHLLPPPPSPWADLCRRFGEIDRSFDRPNLFEKAVGWLRWPAVSKWAPVPIALFLAALLIIRFQRTPTVQAAELLRKAVVAAHGNAAKPHMIQIRTKHLNVRRLAGTKAAVAANSPELNSLQAMFAAAHYDWDDPLCAKSFQTWHDQLPEKHDQVTEQNGRYSIRTETSSGPLTDATLRLAIPDYRPIEEHLQFGGREWVELTEVPASEVPAEAKEEAPKTPPAVMASTEPPAVSPAPVSREATVGDELKVLVELHRAKADLGDPIEVSRSGAQVLVRGVGIAPSRQQEIRTALAADTNVVLRFSEPESRAASAPQPRPEGAVNAEVSQLQARLAEKVGGRVNFEELSAQVLDLTDQMMSRTYALRRLAERFPESATAGLTAADSQTLEGLRQEHTAALVHITGEIDRVLRPVFVSLGLDPQTAAADAGLSRTWQAATEELFQSSREVERLAAVMFGAAPGDSAGSQVPARLMASLIQLRTRLGVYAKIGTEESTRNDR